jgi:DNA-binding beta-propeller fold protein YncE
MALIALILVVPASATAAPVPLAQVGSLGSEAGQLNSPRGLAIDGAGNLYVADAANQRVSVFGSDGTFIHAFGWGVDTGASAFEVCTAASACQVGTQGGGAGQLSNPQAVALDGAGGLYVTDQGNARISVFDTTGPSFIRAFGWDVAEPGGNTAFEVCPTDGACRAGVSGGGAGQLNFPAGLTNDGAGSLYVSDASNRRISVFDTAAPSFTHAFGWGVDTGASMFEVCTTASECQVGSNGGGAGQLNGPGGLAVDGAGNLYVPESVGRRISVFDTAGPTFTRAFGWGVNTGAFTFEVCTSTCQGGHNGGGAGQFDFPRAAALDGDGGLSVAEQSNNRVSVFDTTGPSFTRAFGFGVDTGAPAFEVCSTASTCQVGLFGSAAGQLDSPFGIATDSCGAVWVADTVNGRLQRFGEPSCLPASPSPSVPPAAAPAATTNALCASLRTRLKKLKRRLAQAISQDERSQIKAKIRKVRKKLRKLGC